MVQLLLALLHAGAHAASDCPGTFQLLRAGDPGGTFSRAAVDACVDSVFSSRAAALSAQGWAAHAAGAHARAEELLRAAAAAMPRSARYAMGLAALAHAEVDSCSLVADASVHADSSCTAGRLREVAALYDAVIALTRGGSSSAGGGGGGSSGGALGATAGEPPRAPTEAFAMRGVALYNKLQLLAKEGGGAAEGAASLQALAAAVDEVRALGRGLSRGAQSRVLLRYSAGAGGDAPAVSVSLLELKARALNEFGLAALRDADRALGLSEALRAFHLAFCHAPHPAFRTNYRVAVRDARAEVRALLRQEGWDPGGGGAGGEGGEEAGQQPKKKKKKEKKTSVAELSPAVRLLDAQLPTPGVEASLFFVAPAAEWEALGPELNGGTTAQVEVGVEVELDVEYGEQVVKQHGDRRGWTWDGAATSRLQQLLRATLEPFAPRSAAQGGHKIRGGCGHTPPCRFLEIGTADFDTLAQLYANDGAWRGVSVEPLPHLLHALPTHPMLEKVNAAVSDTVGNALLYTIDTAALDSNPELRAALRGAASLGGRAAEQWTRGVSSFNPQHRDVQALNLGKWYRPRNVTTLTVAALAATTAFRRALCPGSDVTAWRSPLPPGQERRCAIDLLKVDAEGHDARIVLQLVRWARATCSWPRKVQFEVHHAPEAELRAAVAALSEAGYFCRYAAFDMVCVATESQPPCAAAKTLYWQPGDGVQDSERVGLSRSTLS